MGSLTCKIQFVAKFNLSSKLKDALYLLFNMYAKKVDVKMFSNLNVYVYVFLTVVENVLSNFWFMFSIKASVD